MAVDKRSTRLGMLAMVAVLLLGALGTRLWFLQGVQQADYQAKVSAAKTRTVYIPPERGRIFDAEGRVLADNKRVLTVAVDWAVVRNAKNRATLFDHLSGPLHIPVVDLQRRYNPCYGAPSVPKCTKGNIYSTLLPLPLKENVTEDEVNYILSRREDFPGITINEDWKRVYPYAPLASHVIGYLGSITKEVVDDYTARGYNQNERVGQFGVERQLESELHGSWGKRVFEIDASGNIRKELKEQAVEPVAGKDVQLTIDLDVQQYAEQVLETQLLARRTLPDGPTGGRAHNPIDPKTELRVYASSQQWGTTEWVPFKAPAGAVVVEDYSKGQIVAMASYPTFDNRWMGSGIDGAKYKQLFPETDDPDDSILVNRAVQGRYNLGSSIKPFIAWSALHSGIIDASTEFLDQGTYELKSVEPENCQNRGGTARCIFKNAISRGTNLPTTYGPVTVEDALAVSSDAFFYKLGEDFYVKDRNLLKQDLMRFGFGSDSGIQLPFEWDGRIPDDAVKAELVAKKVLGKNEVPRLVVGDNVQVAIGQGLMAATPLQIANAYSTLANNGGFLMQPNIVKAIYAPLTPDAAPAVADLAAGTVVQSFDQPVVRDQLEMPDNVRTPIIDGLKRVITGPGTVYPCSRCFHFTTGYTLFRNYPYDSLPIAGKTGTAQGAGNYPWNDSSAFGAFSVDDDTNLVAETKPYTVVAYLEKSGYGAQAAAPVVKCVFTALAGKLAMDPVLISDPLDTSSTLAAQPKRLANPSCLGNTDARD